MVITGGLVKNNNILDNKDKFLTVLEAASFLNLKVSRLRYEVFHKNVPHFKIGRSIRFSEKDLIAWILNQKQEPKRGSK